MEIRQGTVAQSATIEGIFSQRIELSIATTMDDGTINLLRRLNDGATADEFTPDEVQKGRMWILTCLRIIESAERQTRLGALDPQEVLNTFSSTSNVATSWPFFMEAWPTLQGNFAPDFISYVESQIMQ